MDWAACFFTLVNVWLLAEKNRYGWLFGIAGNLLWVLYAVWPTWQPPLVVLNTLFLGLNARGYYKWSEKKSNCEGGQSKK
jgi:nicotinamide riboside transporter PnuC